MNPTTELVGAFAELAEQLLSLLGRQTLVGGLAVVLVAALARVGRRWHPKLHAGLWLVVFVRLLLPADLGLPVSALSLMSAAVNGVRWVVAPGPMGWSGAADHMAAAATAELTGISSTASGVTLGMAALWLVGAAGVGFRQWRGTARVRRMLAAAEPLREAALLATAMAWQRRFGVQRRVGFVTGRQRVSPFTVGWLRPTVYLPQSLAADPALFEGAIAHELAHVARWDSLWLDLERACRVLYFFNPLVWLASARLVHERERACDRLVVDRGNIPPGGYAHRLLEILSAGLPPAAAATLSASQRRMTTRVASILEARHQPEPSRSATAALMVTFALVLVPLAAIVTTAAPAAASSQSAGVETMTATARGSTLLEPLAGARVTAPFGDWRNPFTGQPGFHNGIDLAAPEGSEVVAPADAKVVVATSDYAAQPGYGTVVVLDHGNGLSSFFAHLGELRVNTGDQVARGQVIATVGLSGRTTGPHLHLETSIGGRPVNPAQLIVGEARAR